MSSIKIGIFYHFAIEERLSSSTVVGSFSYYSPSVPSFITTIIDATFSILKKSIHSLPTVIGLPRHVCLHFNKFKDQIPIPHSLLPAHILAFPVCRVLSRQDGLFGTYIHAPRGHRLADNIRKF